MTDSPALRDHEMMQLIERTLGVSLAAVTLGVEDNPALIGLWAINKVRPNPEQARLIHTLYLILVDLHQHESRQGILSFFYGMDPTLDDRSPALCFREDPERVRRAATNFIVNG